MECALGKRQNSGRSAGITSSTSPGNVTSTVEAVTSEDTLAAVNLLREAGGPHGHKYAIDALVAAMALRAPAPALILTSDRDDWTRLCGDRVVIRDV